MPADAEICSITSACGCPAEGEGLINTSSPSSENRIDVEKIRTYFKRQFIHSLNFVIVGDDATNGINNVMV